MSSAHGSQVEVTPLPQGAQSDANVSSHMHITQIRIELDHYVVLIPSSLVLQSLVSI